MLSTTPDPTADTQAIPSSSAVRSPAVTEPIPWATSSIAPVSSSAPTITNSPTKKNSVGHSSPASTSSTFWWVISSITAAPVSATVAGSRCSAWWAKNSSTVATRIGTVRLSSGMSSIESAASSSMTRSRASRETCSSDR